MKTKKAKDLMIPVSEYASVSEDETLSGIIKVLKAARDNPKSNMKHHSVLVYTGNNRIIGKASVRDIFTALEPRYRQVERPDNLSVDGLSRFGLNPSFLDTLLGDSGSWHESISELLKQSSEIPVRDFMYSPSKEEYVSLEDTLAEAVHKFILGNHRSLLVLKGQDIVGVLRSVDIFDFITEIGQPK